ncbi:MAG TPA: hypothetical protein VH371_07540 [Candidatus Limnocylindrales bacterium]
MRKLLASLVVAATAAAIATGPVSAASNANVWHRLNPDVANPAPEHERLTCARGAEVIVCQYDKVKSAGLHWDNAVARFKGRDVTATWSCPNFFPGQVCDNVHRVWSGRARYWPASGGSFQVDQQMVIVDWGGQKVMFQYWVGQFACPWYRTFGEAKDANPELNFDCIE